MRVKLSLIFLCVTYLLVFVSPLLAQDLGPHFVKVKDGIYVQSSHFSDAAISNICIIVTRDGVVLIDSGNSPTEAREVLAAVKKLTPLPIRYVILTETHDDHTTGNFVFSPPATVIAAAGTTQAMRLAYNPDQIKKRMESPETREAFQGYRFVTPQIEYRGEGATLIV